MQTDISQLTNLIELKAMAYDQISAKEQAEHNLRVINQRIIELTTQQPVNEEHKSE